MREAVIVDIVRTASGKGAVSGALNDVHPVDRLTTRYED
jgi:acetyl-CoA acyltransferase